MSQISPILQISYLIAGQNSPETTMNDAINVLEAIAAAVVKSEVGSAPGSPVNGDLHIATAGGTWGAATVLQHDLVLYNGGWRKITPKAGMVVYNVATSQARRFTTSWVNHP